MLLTAVKIDAQQIFQKSYFTDTVSTSQGGSFLKLRNGDY